MRSDLCGNRAAINREKWKRRQPMMFFDRLDDAVRRRRKLFCARQIGVVPENPIRPDSHGEAELAGAQNRCIFVQGQVRSRAIVVRDMTAADDGDSTRQPRRIAGSPLKGRRGRRR